MKTDKHATSRHYERVKDRLSEAGFSDDASTALLALDMANFQYVRKVMKGEIPQYLMTELNTGLETAHFYALSAILRIQNGFGRPAPQEVTVGLLAEELNLDPSRASRLAADLVDRGMIARAVSQEDGRRSVLLPTDAAMTLMEAFLGAKWQRTIKLFAAWSEADILEFSRLFGRYVDGMREQYPGQN